MCFFFCLSSCAITPRSACSASCGEGTRTRFVSCLETSNGVTRTAPNRQLCAGAPGYPLTDSAFNASVGTGGASSTLA